MINNTKDKKSSSKTQLKMEILEMKKIVNRLTETVAEKDIAIDNLKNINKELNNRLIQLNKMNMEEVMGSSRNSDWV